MKYRLKAYSIWEFGKRVENGGIPHQEDSIFPAHNEAVASDRLFILCDGMGGHDAGEVASGTVCETLSKTIMSLTPDPEGAFSEEVFKLALQNSFNALDAKDSGDQKKKMGTTMTLLKFHNGGYFAAHIGDSRIYQIRPGKTREETKIVFMADPHSLVYELVKAGELTPEEAKHSNQKNIITRAMQPHMEKRSKADIHVSTDIRPGDYFYMCSDGMLENMDNEQLCYFFSDEAGDDERKVSLLTRATQENRDNHSAIIVHILDVIDPIPQVTVSNDDSYVPLEGMVHDGPTSLSRASQMPHVGTPNPQNGNSHRGGSSNWLNRHWKTICLVIVILLLLILAVYGYKSGFFQSILNTSQPPAPVSQESDTTKVLESPSDTLNTTDIPNESDAPEETVNDSEPAVDDNAREENEGETESPSEEGSAEQEKPNNSVDA